MVDMRYNSKKSGAKLQRNIDKFTIEMLKSKKLCIMNYEL